MPVCPSQGQLVEWITKPAIKESAALGAALFFVFVESALSLLPIYRK
jgi:hypothetical protein